MDALQDQIKKLEQELKDKMLENKQMSEEVESHQTTVVYQPKPEKTLKKFKETDDVQEWIETAQRSINKFKNETDKVDLLLNFLDRKPRIEVKFRIQRDKVSAEEIFTILKEVYGLKDSILQLEKDFYSRNQEVGEDLADYSLALMEILMNIEKKDSKYAQSGEERLKNRFADGVGDVALKRELNRLNKERPKLKFHQLRDEALDWFSKEEPPQDTVTVGAVSSQDTSLSQIMQIL